MVFSMAYFISAVGDITMYAYQKHPEWRKVREQSKLAFKWLYVLLCGYKIWYKIEAKKFS